MSLFTKVKLRIVALVSFILTILIGFLGAQRSMMAYGTPEMMASNPDPFGAGKLMIAALVFLIITIATFVTSFFRKE